MERGLSDTLLSKRDSVNFSFPSTFDSSSVSYSTIKRHGKTKSVSISTKEYIFNALGKKH